MAARVITISLRKKLVKIHESRRHGKAISYLREEIARHTNSSPDSVKINQNLNEHIGANTLNRYAPIKVSVNKVGDVIEAEWADAPKKPQQASAKNIKVVSPAAPATGKAPAEATTAKAASEIQKEVKKDISKKVEGKKAEQKPAAAPAAKPEKKAQPKKEDAKKEGAPIAK